MVLEIQLWAFRIWKIHIFGTDSIIYIPVTVLFVRVPEAFGPYSVSVLDITVLFAAIAIKENSNGRIPWLVFFLFSSGESA